MRWFNGTIQAAIEKAKSTHSVFIVYVEGKDADSKSMTETLANVSVTEACEKEHCVAIKLAANSNECIAFNQIYPVVMVPSVYFIKENGIPIEVTGGHRDPETFLVILEEVFKTHRSSGPSAAAAPASEQAAASSTSHPAPTASSPVADSNPSVSSTHADSTTPSVSSTVAEPHLPMSSSTTASSPPPAPAKGSDEAEADLEAPSSNSQTNADKSDADVEEKLERAKERLEELRAAKERRAAEEAREKERERRRLGQDLQKLKQNQEEARQKEVVEQIRKDREAERLARERVRQQIEQDKAERAARYHKAKEEEEEKRSQERMARQQAEQQAAAEAEARRSQFARIQFRLPSGSSVSEQFSATDTLQTALDYICRYMGREVKVATTFPKRTFTREDMTQTMASLQLAPTAVLMVLPAGGGGAVSMSGGGSLLTSLLMMPLNLLAFLWGLLQSFLGGGTAARGSSGPRASTAGASSPTSSSQATGGDRFQGRAQKRTAPAEKRDGKIHRLADTRDDDDEQNTWNGNSTQQM